MAPRGQTSENGCTPPARGLEHSLKNWSEDFHLASGKSFKKATRHSGVVSHVSVGQRGRSAIIRAHLCIVQLLLKDLNIEAVLPPGVQHQRFAYLSCWPIDLKSEYVLNRDLPFKCSVST